MHRAILFDLFDTVVLFQPRVPTLDDAGTPMRSTMEWMVEPVAAELAGVPFDDFLRAVKQVTEEIVRGRPPEYIEVPSRERFHRALVRLGAAGDDLVAKAERLSRAHMRHLAAATELPPEHLSLLGTLRERYRLGLVSNFDHGPTVKHVLARHGLAEMFASVVISDGFGRRKPHPAIFREALRQLGVGPPEAVFVGDSAADDVCGARAAGIAAVWLNARGASFPDDLPTPAHTIARLPQIAAILDREA